MARKRTWLWTGAAAVIILFAAMLTPRAAGAFHSDESCESCHVMHGGHGEGNDVPLWHPNRSQTSLTDFYTNPGGSLNASVAEVSGASKLCLSCHDGSYTEVTGAHRFGSASSGAGMGGLTQSHPVSFSYDAGLLAADSELVDPSAFASDVLDGRGRLQCTSCHDIHAQAASQQSYLRWVEDFHADGGAASASFCRKCHIK